MPDAPDKANKSQPDAADRPRRNFIEQIVDEDIASGKWGPPGDRSVVRTRFPPEPNGYLHIGHATSILLNFGLAEEFGGACNLRFDDTNPVKEEQEFVDSITESIRWLGCRWPDWSESDPTRGVLFASDYFDRMHAWAVELIEKGLAYVDDQSIEDIRKGRGSLTEPGTDSPFRDRPIAESLDLFERMRRGEFPDGARVLRAKIDMASPNMNLRDPVMYRVVNAKHHRTGNAWHIYPMYDWAHGLEDSIEGVTHSLCTLEFENHRPLYDWFIDAINQDRGPGSERGEPIHHPQQIEFAKTAISYTYMGKRHMRQLVEEGHVQGWDDPRMPTISGIRRAGYTPESIRLFAEDATITRFNAVVDYGRLENAAREHLNKVAPRRMAVLDPLAVRIANWPTDDDGKPIVEMLDAINNPEDSAAGTRQVPFSGSLYIEREDFMEDAPKKFFRLKPDGEVRLRCGYWIRCVEVEKNAEGEITGLVCEYDPNTRGGESPPPDAEGNVRKVKGTLHWVSAAHAIDAEVRLFDRLYAAEKPGKATGNHLDDLNKDSLRIVSAKLEPSIAQKTPDEPDWPDGIRRFQFERLGYFCLDRDSKPGALVLNKTVGLRDSWAKASNKG